MKHLTAVLAVLMATGAHGAPMLNDKCGISIKNPPNGMGVFFDENCRTAYVKPPEVGRSELHALAPNLNLQFCGSVKRASDLATSDFETMGLIKKKIDQMISDYNPMLDRIEELRAERDRAEAKSKSAKKKVEEAEALLAEVKAALVRANQELSDCELLNRTEPEKCDVLRSAAKAKSDEYQNTQLTVVRPAQRARDTADLDFEDSSSRVTAFVNRYQEALKPLIQLRNEVADLSSKSFDLFRDYASLEGATGQILFTTQWGELVEAYRALNSDTGVAFTVIPIKEGQVWGSVVAAGRDVGPSIPAVLASSIPGLLSPQAQPTGQAVSTVPLSPTVTSVTSASTLASMSGQVVLSLSGACPFFNSYNDPVRNVNFEQLTAYLTPNATYTYELAARRGYKADYNLATLVTRFEEYKKRGGFFSTSTVHEVTEGNSSSEWFEMTFLADSAEFNYTPAEQEELKKTLKLELADRALKQIATFNSSGAPGLPTNNQTSGASAISVSLGYCPLWYCQVGSLVFGVLDSIFGSSSAVSDFKRNNNVWLHEAVNGISFVNRSSTITFASKRVAVPHP